MDRLALFRRSDERGLVPGAEPQVRLGLILSRCFATLRHFADCSLNDSAHVTPLNGLVAVIRQF